MLQTQGRHMASEPDYAPRWQDPIDCPTCSHVMAKGRVQLRSTLLGFLFRGFSHQPCWFDPDGALARSIKVLSRHFWPGTDSPSAFRCEHCGAVVFQGEGAVMGPEER